MAKRKELWAVREVSGQVDPKPNGGRPTQFAFETSEATGVPKRTINRAVSRVEGVTQEARDAIRGTDLDKGVVLDEQCQSNRSFQLPMHHTALKCLTR